MLFWVRYQQSCFIANSITPKYISAVDLLTYFTLASIEDSIEEVTSDHPEVISMLEETLKMTKDMNFEQPYEKHAEILEEVLREVGKKVQLVNFCPLLSYS